MLIKVICVEIYNDTYCVYVHINKINGKKYVGMTKNGDDPNKRWINGYGYKTCRYFWNAIQKYGLDNFEHEIIADNLTLSEANHFEELLIKKLNTTNVNYGYNLKFGGETNMCSQETRNKMSESQKGKKLSEQTKEKISKNSKSGLAEVKAKISASNKGKKLSDETKRKIGDAAIGRNVGRRHTDEELEKMRKKKTIKKQKNNSTFFHRPHTDETKIKIQESAHKKIVLQKDLNGNILMQYNSLSDASRKTGINLGNISSCCNNRINTAGGFVWDFG